MSLKLYNQRSAICLTNCVIKATIWNLQNWKIRLPLDIPSVAYAWLCGWLLDESSGDISLLHLFDSSSSDNDAIQKDEVSD